MGAKMRRLSQKAWTGLGHWAALTGYGDDTDGLLTDIERAAGGDPDRDILAAQGKVLRACRYLRDGLRRTVRYRVELELEVYEDDGRPSPPEWDWHTALSLRKGEDADAIKVEGIPWKEGEL